MARIGIKGLNESEVRDFIRSLLKFGEMETEEIYMHCRRVFATTDNQIRSLLIYMVRDGELEITDWGSYRLKVSSSDRDVRSYQEPFPTEEEEVQNWFSDYWGVLPPELDDEDDDDEYTWWGF